MSNTVYKLLYAPILYSMSYFATQFLHDNVNANNIAIWLHVAAWIFQFLGHGLAEKRSPKLVDNLVQGILVHFKSVPCGEVYDECPLIINSFIFSSCSRSFFCVLRDPLHARL
jgi:hypothetical protein